MQNDYGNMTYDGLHEYAYNANGRLIGVDGVVSYEYDALGRLAISTSGSVSTYYYYDTAGRVIAEYSTSDDGLNMTLERSFVWGSGFNEILAMDDGTSRKYMLTDSLGSVVAVYDETTAAVCYTTYDAYGNSDAAPASPYGYAGMRYAAEFDGYITPNRAYTPRTGRWLQKDPLGTTPNPQTGNSYAPLTQYTDGANIYLYVNNNPINGRDYLGLMSGYNPMDPWEPALPPDYYKSKSVMQVNIESVCEKYKCCSKTTVKKCITDLTDLISDYQSKMTDFMNSQSDYCDYNYCYEYQREIMSYDLGNDSFTVKEMSGKKTWLTFGPPKQAEEGEDPSHAFVGVWHVCNDEDSPDLTLDPWVMGNIWPFEGNLYKYPSVWF
ncbi:MAG: RHS repeat domain-containing protein [Sedimentisphaeraceae bacterium JB056]